METEGQHLHQPELLNRSSGPRSTISCLPETTGTSRSPTLKLLVQEMSSAGSRTRRQGGPTAKYQAPLAVTPYITRARREAPHQKPHHLQLLFRRPLFRQLLRCRYYSSHRLKICSLFHITSASKKLNSDE